MSSTYDIKIQKVPQSIGTSAKYADTASLLRGNAETNNIKSLSGGNIAVSNNISMLNGAVVTGNLTGTASYATNLTNTTYLITSSYANNVINPPLKALNLQYPNDSTASYAMNALTAAFALNGGTSGGNPDAIPIGSIVAFAANTAPQGWLLCDGGYYEIGVEISATGTYARLYNAISSSASDFGKRYNWSFGSWVENPTGRYFKVPDLRGVFVRGYNNGLVANGDNGVTSVYDSGRKLGSLQQDAFGEHNHDIGFDNYLGSQYGSISVSNTHRQAGWGNAGTNNFSALTSITGGAETRPVNVSLNYYIKYASAILLSDLTTVYNTPVGGDTSGTVSNIKVTGLQNRPIASTVATPVSGAMLQYDGTKWVASNAAASFGTVKAYCKVISDAGSNYRISTNTKNFNITSVSSESVGKITVISSMITTDSIIMVTSYTTEWDAYVKSVGNGFCTIETGRGSFSFEWADFTIMVL